MQSIAAVVSFYMIFIYGPLLKMFLPMFDACEKGRRAIRWRSDKPAELCW
jgi:hypothetical protein